MIIYSLLVYSREYQRQLGAVFNEMKLFQEDQLTMISDLEDDTANFVVTFVALMNAFKHEQNKLTDFHLEPILLKYAEKSAISAILLIENQEDGRFVCSKTTLPLYQDIDFAPFFPKGIFEKEGPQIFLAKDPVFGHALFVALRIPDELDDKRAMTVVCYSLENVIDQLNERKTIFEMNITITDHHLAVLSSTDPDLVDLRFQLFGLGVNVDDEVLKDGSIPLKQTPTVKNGYKFFFMGKKRFCVVANLPGTDAYLVTSVPAEVLLSKMVEQIMRLALLLACVLLVGGVAALFFTRRLGRPLRQLGHVMAEVGEGKLQARYSHDRIGFEINYIGQEFNQMVISLISYIEEVNKERAYKETYAKELQIGHEIQQSILPHREAEFPGVDISVYFNPAKEVAGDFFDWLIKGHELLVTIADGVGKGISGALYAFDLRSILRSFATTHNELKDMVLQTNQLFCYDTKDTGNFVTAFLALYDSKKRKLQYVNCGHNYPFIKRATGELIRLSTKGIAFGVEEIKEVDVKEIDLFPDDFLILYTDGITDAQNVAQELYGEHRFMKVLTASQHIFPDALLNEIIGGIQAFTGGADQYDDMTLIIMKVK